MSKKIIKSIETFLIDTEKEVLIFQDQVRDHPEFELIKFQWIHKIKKDDDYYLVTIEKKYYNDEEDYEQKEN